MRGEPLHTLPDTFFVCSLPKDIIILHNALLSIQEETGTHRSAHTEGCNHLTRLNIEDNGTAMRFLTAYCAQKAGLSIIIEGTKRMYKRPIGQLVDALRELGADIRYLQEEGFPPLQIQGKTLDLSKPVKIDKPLSSQFISALLLIGATVETDNRSPYINITKEVIQNTQHTNALSEKARTHDDNYLLDLANIEKDVSAMAFLLEAACLRNNYDSEAQMLENEARISYSIQGDKVAFELFRQTNNGTLQEWDFSSCPDLYPAAAVACYKKGIKPVFKGLEHLPYKESNRLIAVEENFKRIERGEKAHSYDDHRIAMAFFTAGYEIDDITCVNKSFPAFFSETTQLTRVIPVRESDWQPEWRHYYVEDGLLTIRISDEGKGKKYAIAKAVREVPTKYIWFNDDDVQPPAPLTSADFRQLHTLLSSDPDMLILPLFMSGNKSLLGELQALEYDAIQALTIISAQRGHPVMCAAANMIVKRQSWLRCEEELHQEIPSGDDMFLLDAMKHRKMKINAAPFPILETQPADSLRHLLRQRMRWAGKAPHYKDREILLCATLVVVSNLLAVICPVWLIGKWIVDTLLIARQRQSTAKHLQQTDNLRSTNKKLTAKDYLKTLLLTALYPWYMLICLIGGLFQKKW